MAKRRIFQIAKELNISHTEIVRFLKTNGIDVVSHMSPVDDKSYHLIMTEFAKDKASVERYRKEQVRREIHDTRIRKQQDTHQKLEILSLKDQRQLEKQEAEQAQKEAQERAEEEKRQQAAAEQAREEEQKKQAALKPEPEKKEPPQKRKLRRIDLAEIESQIGITTRRPKPLATPKQEKAQRSAKEAVRQTLAKIDTKAKKKVYKKEKHELVEENQVDAATIQVAEFSSVEELSKIFNVSSSDVIQKCLGLGVLATINQRLDWDVIQLLGGEYGYQAEKVTDVGEELFTLEDTEADLAKAQSRAPVVTVMGHVDHGKTSLLDHIRETNVVGGESGGITQHIGAYRVMLENGKRITFVDTPGHEAFTAMRARGAQVTDMVVLVVAANDGVMPQTVEAIDHARAAAVPLVVAINKIDLPNIDQEKIKRELSEQEVLVEDWGGKVQTVPISAKTGQGVDDLLTAIMLESEMLELKANRDTLARGTVIDSKLDRGHGPIATVLIQKGTLKVGDPFICDGVSGKVRAMMNERLQKVKIAEPSDAVQILGFDRVPQSADIFAVVESERELKRVVAQRQRLKREIDQKRISAQSLDAMSALIKEGAIKKLPLIIKGDVDGSIEALSETLEKINTEEVGVQVIHKSVGMVSESDVLLAAASQAVIIGFNVQLSANAKLQAKQEGVEIRTYTVIYTVVEEIKLALEGMLEPEQVEEITGRALVQAQFKVPKVGNIAGVKVTEGLIQRNSRARLIRDDQVVSAGEIISLKHFKDDVTQVKNGMECGIALSGVDSYEDGDTIVAYEIKSVKRKLEAH